jgi:HK97 family phage prohead protease
MMPMPQPESDEAREEWMSRCMSNETMVEEYPDADQRAAVCHGIWGENKMPTDQDMQKFFIRGTAKTIDRKNRTMEIVATEKVQDRDGDIVEPSGGDFSSYLKNPVALWAHDSSQPPIAKVLEVLVDENRVVLKLQFKNRGKAVEVFEDYAEGYLNAWSLGFIPKKVEKIWGEPDDNGESEFEGFHVQEWEMMEISAVPIPANPKALTRSKSMSQKMAHEYLEAHPKAKRMMKSEEKEEDFIQYTLSYTLGDFVMGADVISAEGADGSRKAMRPSALKKSLKERSEKIPWDVRTVANLYDVGLTVEMEVLDEKEGEITQARVIKVCSMILSDSEKLASSEDRNSESAPSTEDRGENDGSAEENRPAKRHRIIEAELLEAEAQMKMFMKGDA